MLTIGLTHYLVVGAVLFCTGVFTMATKRNAIGILIGVELVLNSSNVNLLAFDRYLWPGRVDAQIMAIFVIVLAAAHFTSGTLLGRVGVGIADGNLLQTRLHAGHRNIVAAEASPVDHEPCVRNFGDAVDSIEPNL